MFLTGCCIAASLGPRLTRYLPRPILSSKILSSDVGDRLVKLVWCLAVLLLIVPQAWADQKPPTLDQAYVTCGKATTSARTAQDLQIGLAACSQVIATPKQRPEIQAQALAARGLLRLRLNRFAGDNAASLADFNAALAALPGYPNALAGRAQIYLRAGNYAKAAADLTQLMASQPPNPELLLARGEAYNRLGQYDLAIADFDVALKLAPSFAEALNDRAFALDAQGHFQAALQDYDSALALAGPARGIVLDNRSATKVHMGDFVGALADCDAAIAANPDDPHVYAARAKVYVAQKKFAAAIADDTQALSLAPQDPFALFVRGVARVEAGQTHAGRTDIKAAEQFRPSIQADMAKDGILLPSGS
jgi:tetratricopeptide (TPR) repeat protein